MDGLDADCGTYFPCDTSVYFGRLDTDLVELMAPVRVSDGAHLSVAAGGPIWTGSEYAVAWVDALEDGWETRFARFTPDGERVTDDTVISDASAGTVGWSGSTFNLVWMNGSDGNLDLWMTALDNRGATLGDPVRLTEDEGSSSGPRLAWTGSAYGMAWLDGREDECGFSDDSCQHDVFFVMLDNLGNKLSEDLKLSIGGIWSAQPSIAWTGSEFGVAWMESEGGLFTLMFERISLCD
jgi:hypothetical protein